MTESAENRAPGPQCCAAATADGKTTASTGITVNGFHDRKGQPPGLRLLFAEEQYRRRTSRANPCAKPASKGPDLVAVDTQLFANVTGGGAKMWEYEAK